MPTIPQSHVDTMREGKAIIPIVGKTPCSPAGICYMLCTSYEDGKPCTGYTPLKDPEIALRILNNLSDVDRLYVGNAIQTIERSLIQKDFENATLIANDVKQFFKSPNAPFKMKEAVTRNIDIQRTATPPLSYPDQCTASCAHKFCPFNREENYGAMCLQRAEQYRNR